MKFGTFDRNKSGFARLPDFIPRTALRDDLAQSVAPSRCNFETRTSLSIFDWLGFAPVLGGQGSIEDPVVAAE